MLMIDKKDGVLYTEITGESMQVMAELSLLVTTVHEAMKEHIDVYESLSDPTGKMLVKQFLEGLKQKNEQEEPERKADDTESKE